MKQPVRSPKIRGRKKKNGKVPKGQKLSNTEDDSVTPVELCIQKNNRTIVQTSKLQST